MTRDQVIECAKDWLTLLTLSTQAEKCIVFERNHLEGTIERQDVLNACVDLAFNRARDSLEAYTKDRMAQFEAHERMLDTIEQTLQESIKDGF